MASITTKIRFSDRVDIGNTLMEGHLVELLHIPYDPIKFFIQGEFRRKVMFGDGGN